MTRERAKRLAAEWSFGGVCTLREGEAAEYHKLFYDLLCQQEQERKTKWISVKDRLPKTETRVLVFIHRHSNFTNKDYSIVTCGIYEDGKVNVEDSCWCCEDGDYDEETDNTYVPKGWYEFHEYGNTEEDGIGFIGYDTYLEDTVTHWMPMPEPPGDGTI